MCVFVYKILFLHCMFFIWSKLESLDLYWKILRFSGRLRCLSAWIGLFNCEDRNRRWDYIFTNLLGLFIKYAFYPHCTRLHDLLYAVCAKWLCISHRLGRLKKTHKLYYIALHHIIWHYMSISYTTILQTKLTAETAAKVDRVLFVLVCKYI